MTLSSPRRATKQVFAAVAGAVLVIGLGAAGATADSTSADDAGRPLSAVLSGANEVNEAGAPNQGDLNGNGSAKVTVNPGQNTLCVSLEVTGTDVIRGAHIHDAVAGQNGPIVVNLLPEGQTFSTSFERCVTVERGLLDEIRKNPAEYYVNLHNAEFPAGAVRGQLSK